MSNRDIRNLVGLCSFYVEFVSHRFAPSVFAVRFHWNHKFPSNVWQQFREWRFFSNLAMAPSSRLVLGVPRERLATLIKFEQFLSSPLSLYCCISTIFAIVLRQFLFLIPLSCFAVVGVEGKLRNRWKVQRSLVCMAPTRCLISIIMWHDVIYPLKYVLWNIQSLRSGLKETMRFKSLVQPT